MAGTVQGLVGGASTTSRTFTPNASACTKTSSCGARVPVPPRGPAAGHLFPVWRPGPFTRGQMAWGTLRLMFLLRREFTHEEGMNKIHRVINPVYFYRFPRPGPIRWGWP